MTRRKPKHPPRSISVRYETYAAIKLAEHRSETTPSQFVDRLLVRWLNKLEQKP